MKKLIIILAAAAMTGCGIYKPYTRPEVKTDGLYGTAETADTTTIGNLGWEEMFTDPYLRTLIRQGLEKAQNLLLEPWYRARSFTICHNDKLTDELFSRDIVERLRQDFTFLLPYYDYFVTLEGDPDPRDAAPV